MKNKTTQDYKVTAEGSLGLLALGSVGVKLWKEAMKKKNQTKKDKKDNDGKAAK